MRFDRTTPVRMPFRIGHLPPGLQPVNVHNGMPADGTAYASVLLSGPNGMVEIAAMPHMKIDLPEGGPPSMRPTLIENRLAAIRPAANATDPATWFDAEDAIPIR